MGYLIFSTMSDFRLFNDRLNAHFGYPKPGVNAATGLVVNADGAIKNPRGDRQGWTERYTAPSEQPDGQFLAWVDQLGMDAVDGLGQPLVTASERARMKTRDEVRADPNLVILRPNVSELARTDGRPDPGPPPPRPAR